MKDFLRNTYYFAREAYADKISAFWMIMFPIFLATFFYLGLGSLVTGTPDLKIKVGIDEQSQVAKIYEQIPLLKVTRLKEEEATKELRNEKIDGYVRKDNSLMFLQTGTVQEILKNISDEITQISESGISYDKFDFQKEFIRPERENITIMANLFYTLVAMVSFYSVMGGIDATTFLQPWDSRVALRANISPKSKLSFLLEGATVSVVFTAVSALLLMGYIQFVLGIHIFKQDWHNIWIVVLASFAGNGIGIFLGVFLRIKLGAKTAIGIFVLNFLGFMNGMMMPGIKTLVETKAPFLMQINPLAIVAENFIRINVYRQYDKMFGASVVLILVGVIFYTLGIFRMRGDQFDSI